MTDEKPDEKSDKEPEDRVDEGSDESPDEKLDEEPEEKVDEKVDESPDEKPEEPEEMPEEKPYEEPDEEPEESREKSSGKRRDDNTVYIGTKPTMNYVLAVVTQFNSGSPEIILKARGRAISRAVDVAEIVRNRFVSTATVKDIVIDTEPLDTEEGASINVSSIEIKLAMGK